MESITLNLLDNNITINGNDITINCKQNKNLLISKETENSIKLTNKNYIRFNEYTIIVDDKSIEILYKNNIKLNVINSTTNIDIEQEYNKIIYELDNEINKNKINTSESEVKNKSINSVEQIIKARQLEKINRMKKYGLLYCDNEDEYNNLLRNLDDANRKNIIVINFKLKKEINEILKKMNKIEKFNENEICEKRIDMLFQLCSTSSMIKYIVDNIKLFSENEKFKKQFEKYKENILKKYNDNKLQLIEKRRRKRSYSRSGFLKPCEITSELRQFLNSSNGQPIDLEISRVDATKIIHKYIMDNNLQNKDNRRIIHPNNLLIKLFNLKYQNKTGYYYDDRELTYFNLQNHLNKHFIKK